VTDTLGVYLDELRQLIDAALARALPPAAPELLGSAMRYALAGGGKRLRPCLTLAAADAIAANTGESELRTRSLALPAACAIEMIHTYSLVHDDLPAMDDDDLRRGRPTTHVVYGDGLAILVGDGLLTDAIAVVTDADSRVAGPGAPHLSADRRLRIVDVIVRAAGSVGMVGGQAIDLAAAGRVTGHTARPFDAAALEDMHARKTGALIRAASTIGAVAAGAGDATVAAVDEYATHLGLAFQIIDDVLDIEGSNDALGKTAGKDALAGKPTYPSLYGVARSRQMAAVCIDRARAAINAAGLDGRLGEIATWSLSRSR